VGIIGIFVRRLQGGLQQLYRTQNICEPELRHSKRRGRWKGQGGARRQMRYRFPYLGWSTCVFVTVNEARICLAAGVLRSWTNGGCGTPLYNWTVGCFLVLRHTHVLFCPDIFVFSTFSVTEDVTRTDFERNENAWWSIWNCVTLLHCTATCSLLTFIIILGLLYKRNLIFCSITFQHF
jgi:hypothetical protein